MSSDAILDAICDELVAAHGVHTILLYGSRADASANADSDYDIAAFGPVAKEFRVARVLHGAYLDVFVYPADALAAPGVEFLKLRGSRIIRQRGTDADDALATLNAVFDRGPELLPADEIEARKVWAHKMLARMQRGDPEGHYRRSWLLMALLEDYFQLRGLWYLGPKKALRWLQQADPATHAAMVQALAPGAGDDAIAALVQRVTGTMP